MPSGPIDPAGTVGARIVPVQKHECASVGLMLAGAFAEDPLWYALWPDATHRQQSLTRMLGALTRTTLAAGGFARATGNGSAVALWTQPGVKLDAWAQIRARLALPRSVMRLPRSEMRALLAVLDRMEKRRKALVPEPHWYLQCIGVDPTRQGAGLGAALVREGLALADRDGATAYLETETDFNVAFYTHLGFSVLEKHQLDELGVPIWLMARPTSPV
jgi:ribosomal protein S18 acetylase RimI-like enzyme